MPEAPNECVCIYDTGGLRPLICIGGNEKYEEPTIQVRIRGDKGKYKQAYTLIQGIRDTLHGTYEYTINGARYILIWCTSDILFLNYDENRRPLLSVNFRTIRAQA